MKQIIIDWLREHYFNDITVGSYYITINNIINGSCPQMVVTDDCIEIYYSTHHAVLGLYKHKLFLCSPLLFRDLSMIIDEYLAY